MNSFLLAALSQQFLFPFLFLSFIFFYILIEKSVAFNIRRWLTEWCKTFPSSFYDPIPSAPRIICLQTTNLSFKEKEEEEAFVLIPCTYFIANSVVCVCVCCTAAALCAAPLQSTSLDCLWIFKKQIPLRSTWEESFQIFKCNHQADRQNFFFLGIFKMHFDYSLFLHVTTTNK